MDSRDESLPMSPTKHIFTVFGPTPPISQRDIMRSDDFREDGDLCEDEDDEEEGSALWPTAAAAAAVGSLLGGPLEAIMEEDSGGEEEAKSVNSSLAERLSLGYFDIPLTKKAAPLEKPTPGKTNPQIVTDLDTDHFGRPRTAERPTTPLPEKREQKKLEPSPFIRSSSPACIDCIASGSHHHHGRPSIQSPQPSWSDYANGPLASSLKDIVETSSEPTLARQAISTNLTTPAKAASTIPPKSTVHSETGSKNFSTPPKYAYESPVSTDRRMTTLPVRESTPTRESTALQVSIPTPPKEHISNPHEHPHERRLLNPTTPARQRAPAIPPTPPTTPARRKSLPSDFSTIRKSNPNLPTPVEEERPTTSSGIVSEAQGGHSYGDGEDGHRCPFASRDRGSKEMRHSRSYSFHSRPSTPEPGRSLSHSYSAPDIPRLTNRATNSPEPSRLSAYNAYSRPTTPEFSRLSHTYTYSRPGSSDGSRLAYSYSRPTTPEVVFSGTGTRVPFVDVSEPVSRMPSPPPPTVASSTGTSPASSMHLRPLAPPIEFGRDSTARTAPRAVTRSISSEELSVADRFFRSVLEGRHRGEQGQHSEPESPEEELTPESKAAEPETPKIEAPRIEAPKIETPKIETPEIETPEIETPKIEVPKIKISEPAVEPPAPVVYHFIMTFVLPRATKYYLQGPVFWNIFISLCIAFFVLGVLVTICNGAIYVFGDGITSNGLPSALFGEGKLLEDLSPLIAFLSYLGVFVWVTIFSRRTLNPNSKDIKKPGLLVEFFGPQQAASIKRLFSPKRVKTIILLFLITVGTTGLYLGAQTIGPLVGPPITAAMNKGVMASVDYWNTIRAPAMEIPAEIEVQAGVPDAWDEMDFIYFQPDGKAGEDGGYSSSMEGSYGTYYPSSEDKGYHGDEDELGWGAVIRLGLALIIGPAGAMAWRQRRSM